MYLFLLYEIGHDSIVGCMTKKFSNPILFAHNYEKFDGVILCRAMQSVPNLKLEESFCGFCDTLRLLKTKQSKTSKVILRKH